MNKEGGQIPPGLLAAIKRTGGSETVEKVPKQILGGDAEKNDFTECATINDLTITGGYETPQKPPINYTEGFFDSLSRYDHPRKAYQKKIKFARVS